MSFTEDELQAFNTILEQRLAVHRKEVEQAIDSRMSELRRDMEQRWGSVQQDTTRILTQRLSEHENRLDATLTLKLNSQQTRIAQMVAQEGERKQQQLEGAVDRMLAAQLLGIEQLLSQHFSGLGLEPGEMRAVAPEVQGAPPQLEAIEVQTELQWEDLLEVIGKALDERLSVLNDSMLRSIKNLEQYLSVRMHSLRDEIARHQNQAQSYAGGVTSVQEMLHGIEHLERVIESMQVAMTANHALLSNRLFHHQQLPLERAHPSNLPRSAANGTSTPLSIAKERVASGLEPEIEEPKG
jgi:hypothetical protein